MSFEVMCMSGKCFFHADVLSGDLAVKPTSSMTTSVPDTEQETNITSTTEPATTITPTTEPATTIIPTTEPATTIIPTTEPATTARPTTDPSVVCGGSGWRRVAFLDMTDPNQDCPQGLHLTNYPIRSCGRASNAGADSCFVATYPVDGPQYSEVCGRATAYRFGFTQGFYDATRYGDGLTLTHGEGLQTHIWSFISGYFSGTISSTYQSSRCPCDPSNTITPPLFVGNDYFCESVETADNFHIDPFRFFPDNALWDGQDHLNPCYGNNNPPWFNKILPIPSTDDIDAYVCLDSSEQLAGIALQLLEIYVR